MHRLTRFGSIAAAAGVAALMMGGPAEAASDITIAAITIGRLYVVGTTERPHTPVVLDDRFRTESDDKGKFQYEVVYHPARCIVSAVIDGKAYEAVVSNCSQQCQVAPQKDGAGPAPVAVTPPLPAELRPVGPPAAPAPAAKPPVKLAVPPAPPARIGALAPPDPFKDKPVVENPAEKPAAGTPAAERPAEKPAARPVPAPARPAQADRAPVPRKPVQHAAPQPKPAPPPKPARKPRPAIDNAGDAEPPIAD
jgi:hypothetical protein